ncbi:MAG TPA: protein kinase, partial [Nannocystaceae bacterium]|nr:protein kinase [Nannocystaceae bacterium]
MGQGRASFEGTAVTSSECIAPDDVVALLAGELDEAATAALDAHVDACQQCLELLAAVVRSPALVAAATHGSASMSSALEEPTSAVANVLARVHPGERIARYVVREEVGHGGMGVVYAAWDPELDRRVAIKLLRARVRGSAQARARLLREARAIAQLSHRNVISVFDVGEVELAGERIVFLAMELIDGPNLRTWRWQQPRGWREIVHVYLEAARGLQAAHAAGVIHRDFKPGNVMISSAQRVVVLDFGLARVAAELEPSWDVGDDELGASGSSRLTSPKALLGTPGYIAPELQRGGVADARSDEWSLCMTLAEALCGVHPQLERGSVPLAKLLARARVPLALRRVLERGLADDPGARHGSMYEVCNALESVLAQRQWRVLGLVAAGGLVPVAALALAWMPADRDACAHSESRLATTWDDARRA